MIELVIICFTVLMVVGLIANTTIKYVEIKYKKTSFVDFLGKNSTTNEE